MKEYERYVLGMRSMGISRGKLTGERECICMNVAAVLKVDENYLVEGWNKQ